MKSFRQKRAHRRQLNELKSWLLRFWPGLLALLSVVFVFVAVQQWDRVASEGQKSYSSPQGAVDALVSALRNDNDDELLNILGPDSAELISSGDAVADQHGKTQFLSAYEQKNTLDRVNENRMILMVGDRDYPFPLPIVQQREVWFFDARAGKEEILNRHIGRNELNTIEVMRTYTDAQREYACLVRNDGVAAFAQNLASSKGIKDGLYWEKRDGELESPLGPRIAKASEQCYRIDQDNPFPEPFNGYLYKIIKAQGEHATGGAFDYAINGKMVLGFSLLAHPAKYGSSGIMTFIINQQSQIYQKDLGEQTSEVAAEIMTFDPDNSWKKYK
ncbi:MAG: DUF2950 domain-containing protein [Deltaproteobacteria bacterium]|nr:DUF2950 domain-containing protein [Deltaproteobacteria bacterium]